MHSSPLPRVLYHPRAYIALMPRVMAAALRAAASRVRVRVWRALLVTRVDKIIFIVVSIQYYSLLVAPHPSTRDPIRLYTRESPRVATGDARALSVSLGAGLPKAYCTVSGKGSPRIR